jgi:hypothetical protein
VNEKDLVKQGDTKMSVKTTNPNQTHEAAHKQPVTKPAAREQVASTPQSDLEDRQHAAADLGLARPADVLALQRLAGNRAVQRLIQARLTVGPTGDQYEQEADRVAEQVMSMPEGQQQPASDGQSPVQRAAEEEDELQMKPLAASITPLVQRVPEEEEELQMKPLAERLQRIEEDEEALQARPEVQHASSGAGFEVGGKFEQQLAASQGGGSPLPADVRSFMEPRFGADFSGVRIHTGGDAVQLNREVSAQAFTHGTDIYLGAGKSDLGSAQGKQLLAHELTHVVQQGGSTIRQAQAVQRSVTFKRDEVTTEPDITIADYTPAGSEKIAVDEAVGYIAAGTEVEKQAWVIARIATNGNKVPNAVKKFKWGEIHINRDGDLPGKKGAGGYKEYYVRKGDGTDGGEHPQRRIIIRDSDSKKFYTNTHYGRDGAPAFYELKT